MRSITIVFCALIVLVFVQPSPATIIHVPADQLTIQSGINSSTNGDTILVSPGTYYEHIDFGGKAILVKSEGSAENTLIIEAPDSAGRSGVPLVTFDSGEDTTSILDGFTIRGSKINTLNNGAIRCQSSSPTIRNNILTQNGGDQGYEGAVVWLQNSHASITNNQIKDNFHAIGIFSYDSQCSARVSGNLIVRNWVGIDSHGDDDIVNNTFCCHSRFNVEVYGPALVKNNIIVKGNVGIANRSGTLTVFSYNDVWGNVTDYDETTPGPGDISENPLFCDAAGDDFHLFQISPCLGAGEGGADMGAFGVGCGGGVNRTWYVSVTGNDTAGDGSQNDPFRTIQKGIGRASLSGDTVLVSPGTYYEHITFEGKAVMVKSEGGAENTIIGETSDSLNYTGDPLVVFDWGEDSTSILDGFTIRGAKIYTLSNGAIRCQSSSPIIRNNILTLNGGAEGFEGAVVWLRNSHACVTHNQIKNNPYGIGIFCYDTTTSAKVWGNLIVRNWVGINSHGDEDIINNTFYSHPRFNVELFGLASVKNNIIVGGGVGIEDRSGGLVVNSYNDVWGNVIEYDGGSPGIGDISANPLFCDVGSDDFHLLQDSPCLGTGEGGVDMGAYGEGCSGYVHRTWYVSVTGNDSTGDGSQNNPFRTIQKGIGRSSLSDDTVLVSPGTYNEHINFDGKAVLVKSQMGAENTIISETADSLGPSGVPLVTFDLGEDTTSILDGFTIHGAVINTLSNGAIRCRSSSPTIRNNILTQNGGDEGAEGAVVWLQNSQAYVTHNQIKDNQYAIGILCYDALCSAKVSGNLIVRNWVGIDSHGDDYIINNTFSSHPRFNVEVYGSALVKNNIIVQGDVGIEDRSGGLVVNSYNDVWGNVTGYNGGLPGVGDISANPLFCDAAVDDFHLYRNSPCLGAGESGADMGAFSEGCIRGDVNSDGAIDISDVLYLINYLYRTGPPPDPLLAGDANCNGFIEVDDVIYLINFLFHSGPVPGC